jgi:KTSC domain
MPVASKQVEMIEVKSSNILSIGYSEKSARLFVRFKDGDRLYFYDPVPPIVWLGLLYSQSKGRYLSSQIVPFFRYSRAKETDLILGASADGN